MNYHNITHDDMNNGDGLRVVLWLSGCSHHCYNCQNPQTWNPDSGIPFDESAKQEIFNELSKDYISGITFSGGDPLYENNLDEVLKLVKEIRISFPTKTIWLYTGYSYSEIFRGQLSCWSQEGLNNFKRREIIKLCNIMVDGEYIDAQKDLSLKFRGSKNQNCIDVKQSLAKNKMILYCD
ncbi:anaerobic ribonucleoside-triphosphate reductase activating protein [Clostridium sp. AF34-13]|nr:anaerobic ribonucleoside-triphosphate reductase activating protein [Clostridium sp. AF34-13]RHP22578.1 anaerobic ribonucleoside-triphosphate reductase activating protein [Clostridium sp. AF34-13]